MDPDEKTMESLSQDTIKTISQYLSPSDLGRCCTQSKRWREIFGADDLWRVHCDEALADVLDEKNCLVQPTFKSPSPDGSTLSAINDWRLNFMKQNRLKKNCSTGNFRLSRREVRIVNEYIKSIFFKDHYLLIFTDKDLQVWEVHRTPQFVTSFPFITNHGSDLHVFQVYESDTLVVVNGLLVRVYKLGCVEKSLELLHEFSFETSENCAESIDESAQEPCKKKARKETEARICTVVGNVFVGIVTSLSPPRMHIWSVETGQKLKELDCPFRTIHRWYTGIPACKQTMNIVLEGEDRVDGRRVGHWYVYNLLSLKLLPFHEVRKLLNENVTYRSVIFHKYVCVKMDDSLRLYDYFTSDIITHMLSCNGDHVLSFGNSVVFDDYDRIHAVNPGDCKGKINFLIRHAFDKAEAVGNLAILSYSYSNDTSLERTDIKSFNSGRGSGSLPLYHAAAGDSCLINHSGTKLLMTKVDFYTKFLVVNFW